MSALRSVDDLILATNLFIAGQIDPPAFGSMVVVFENHLRTWSTETQRQYEDPTVSGLCRVCTRLAFEPDGLMHLSAEFRKLSENYNTRRG